jgi:hypothetical protein
VYTQPLLQAEAEEDVAVVVEAEGVFLMVSLTIEIEEECCSSFI